MRKLLMAAFMSVLALGLSVGEAEAARLGGGKSFGMQRSVYKPAPTRQATQPAPAPAGTTAAAPKRNWMGPIAGLAAGLGIAALLSHFGLGEGMANILTIALLVMAAVFIFRLLMRCSTPATADNSLRYAGAGESNVQVPPQAVSQPASSSSTTEPDGATIPAGFDVEGFLRVAKLNFIRLQAANDAKNVEDIREFVSPELFAEIKMQMDERSEASQQTDVVTLNAELLEVVTEGERHIATVRFNGMIREVAGAAAESFDEAWVLTKAKDGNKGWTVSGIQQMN